MFEENKPIALLQRYIPGYHIYISTSDSNVLYCNLGNTDNFVFNLAAEPEELHSHKELPEESYLEAKELGTITANDESISVVSYGAEEGSIIIYSDTNPNSYFEMSFDVFSNLSDSQLAELKETRPERSLSNPYQCFVEDSLLVIY